MKTLLLLKKYLKYIKFYRSIFKTLIVLMLVWITINFIPPWLVKVLIDDVFPRQDIWLLNIIVIAYLFIVLNSIFMSNIKNYLFTYLAQRINLDINLNLFDHLMALPIQFFNNNETGALTHRFMQDITQIRDIITNIIVNIVVNSIMLLMLFVVLFYINFKLAFICLAIAVIYGINVNIFKNRIYSSARDMGERTGELYTLLCQITPCIREIKSLRLSKHVKRMYADGLIKFFRVQIKNFRLGVYVSLITDILPPMAWAAIILAGGREVIKGTLSIGSLLAFTNYLDKIYAPIKELSGIYSETQRVIPAMERVAKIFDTLPEFNTYKGHRIVLKDITGYLRLNSLGFGYSKDIPVLKNINMDIKPGSKTAIVGPSGCGKSTIAHLMIRFFDTYSGSIYLDDINIKQINLNNYRKHIGIVPQGIRLFTTTIKENILMGNRHASEEDVINAAKAANAHEFIMNLLDGYNTLYGEKGVWLSGGEIQRIVIARAILQNSKILILDEATSSVDANSEALIHNAINRISINKTLIVIAHRFSTIIDADRIYVMDKGMIVSEGTHETLIKDNLLYNSLYKKQIKEYANQA